MSQAQPDPLADLGLSGRSIGSLTSTAPLVGTPPTFVTVTVKDAFACPCVKLPV
jgi:hypothetical protein